MNKAITYYGMDESLKTVERGAVTLGEALKIIEDRFAALKPTHETGEEAISETMFGFSRTENTFIEISLLVPTQISFKLEIPQAKKFLIFQNIYQRETELQSKDELIEQVKAFFSMEIEDYREFFESRCK